MTDWLLDTLIATSALMVLVLVLREPVRRRFGSRVAYALWLLPAARMLMPAISTTVERAVPAPASETAAAPAMAPQLLASVAPSQSMVEQMGGWPTIMITLWLGVAAGLCLNRILAFRRERRLILDQSVQLARLGSIRLVRSRAVSGPLAFGLIDRVVAVPPDFDRRFDDRERCLALDHELAHHRSGDLATNQFAFVLLCLQWFNPLAWASYAAFRFDQEAACDARVLDKAAPADRADYGRAIAKAASGRSLLFSAALDRPTTLHRRLKSMLYPTQRGRRIAGSAMVVATIAIVLPLTATRAIDYVDVAAAPRPIVPVFAVSPVSPIAPVAPVARLAAVAVVAPVAPVTPVIDVGGSQIMVKGNEVDWESMTPEQRSEMRRELAEARREIANGRSEAAREIAAARAEIEAVDFAGEIAGAQREIASAMRDIDANAAELRRAGQDPEMIKAQVRRSLENLDVQAIKRHALAGIDEKSIEASIRGAEESIARMEAELDRLDRRHQ